MVSNKVLQWFYRGVFFGAISSALVIGVVYLLYPKYTLHTTNFNYLTNKGMVGSQLVNEAFYKNITNNNGISIFGTSESGGLGTRPKASNYWYYLGQQFGLSPFIYTMGGAGNTPYMWLSALCDLAENSRVYYVVNPIYFTKSLNSSESILSYKDRYLSKETFGNASACVRKHLSNGSVDKFEDIFSNQEFKTMPLRTEIAYFVNEAYNTFFTKRSVFKGANGDFVRHIERDKDWSEQYNVADWIISERDNSGFTTYDIPKDFFESARFIELLIAKQIADAKKIDLRFVLMPPNYVFFEEFGSKYPQQFNEIVDELKDRLCDKNNCIDLTDESYAKGMFIDAMHFSSYGANLVADELINDINRNSR